jgi:hypothetical protein
MAYLLTTGVRHTVAAGLEGQPATQRALGLPLHVANPCVTY